MVVNRHQNNNSRTADTGRDDRPIAQVSKKNTPTGPRYTCEKEGCGKSFMRLDRLKRHALNHGEGNNICPRCSLDFMRPDLLARHMDRHTKKDQEAGGYGRGVLMTRRRMFRNANGEIISRPGERHARKNAARQTPPSSTAHSDSHSQHDQDQEQDSQQGQVPISPSKSPQAVFEEQSPIASHSQGEFMPSPEDHAMTSSMLASGMDTGFSTTGSEYFEHAAVEQWATLDHPSDIPDNNDMFNPDAASSFNQPFTTLSNYTWLFDANTGNEMFLPESAPLTEATISSRNHVPEPSIEPWFMTSTIPSLDITNYPPPIEGNIVGSPEDHSNPMSQTLSLPQSADANALGSNAQAPSTFMQPINQISWSTSKNVLQGHSVGNGLPMITASAREKILSIISRTQPRTIAGIEIGPQSPLLSLSALQNYFDLFFTRFNNAYPLVHQATFDPSTTEPLLLTSMLLLGATYGAKDCHMMAVCIHDGLRALIFAHPAFNPQPELWVLQTILLVECFGKSRAGQRQHDMAHLFHGLLINLIRRSDCQSIITPLQRDGNENLESYWKRSMNAEQKKRLALLCFLWDTQHAVLFSQSLCMSAFELRLSLPCNAATWEAQSAEDWYEYARGESPPPLFLQTLRAYTAPDIISASRNVNMPSRLLLLHGLMSISWDLNRRDQTSLGAGGIIGEGAWKHRLGRSYDLWKADFDSDCIAQKLSLRNSTRKFTSMKVATLAIYHAAHIILNAEILDLQLYAGAEQIPGRGIKPPNYERAKEYALHWINDESRCASTAAWHAVRILHDNIMNLDDWDDNDLFHYPWCLYLATLTCWAFNYTAQQVSPNPIAGSSNSSGSDHSSLPGSGLCSSHLGDGIFDDEAEMTTLVVGMRSCKSVEDLKRVAGHFRTNGLTNVMAKRLSLVRWAIVRAGMKILQVLALRAAD
ncbi:MAG: hypothetical protein M1834_006377 [Cirrosporium novae-zelandiae]|nr:MAG: hypothetical protein M1834_006377 [Cirrosporium novae-zelandiae]